MPSLEAEMLEFIKRGIDHHAQSCPLAPRAILLNPGNHELFGWEIEDRGRYLMGCLGGADVAATAEVRRDGKGRHTTTHRELVILPGGGVLVDTPGLRGAGIWLDGDGLAQAFPEIDELTEQCRFSDCGHNTEPGCAILAALETGTLPQRRWDSWRKLQREAEWIAARSDARLRAERGRQWKRISREVRQSGRIRP